MNAVVKIKLNLILLCSAVLILSACASPASKEGMTPSNISYGKQAPYTVKVQTDGGAETTAVDSSNISNEDLKASIENAIINSKIFKGVVNGKGGDYDLIVSVTSLSKPIFGGTFHVEFETVWTLIRTQDKFIVMKKAVQSTGTATFGDALPAVTRLRIAVERAASENITLGLKSIAAKDF
jgi:hypothetical protein